MLFRSICLISAAISVQAFTVPDGQEPGVYLARYAANGTEEHIPMALVKKDLEITLAKRDPDQPSKSPIIPPINEYEDFWCGCDVHFNHANCDKAVQGLLDQIGSGDKTIPPDQSLYSITNAGDFSVVAFVCNTWSPLPYTTNGDKVRKLLSDITVQCGQYNAGTVFSAATQMFYGYMAYGKNVDFCHDAMNGWQPPCGH